MIVNITQAVIISIITLIITTVVSIIGFFLKRTMGRVDKCEERLEEIPNKYESAKQHAKDIADFKEELKGVKADVKTISNDFLKKEDFVRKMSEIDTKFERLEDKIDRNARETSSKLDKILERI